MWKDLSREWKATYELAWTAFCSGSIPIGCIITDASGDTIIAGRNETCENHYPNRRTAHAEMYCMRNLDIENLLTLAISIDACTAHRGMVSCTAV